MDEAERKLVLELYADAYELGKILRVLMGEQRGAPVPERIYIWQAAMDAGDRALQRHARILANKELYVPYRQPEQLS